MPKCLVLRFLGLPQLHLDDKPISTDRRKAIALLAYLAVNDLDQTPQRYSREFLSALLWPEVDQTKAFSNLRTIIWEVRQTLGEGWLLADRESIQLNREARIDLDIARFRGLVLQAGKENDPALRIPPLSDAVKLYRGHFLTGFSLKDAPNFHDWAFAKSEELRRQFAEALAMLANDHSTLGQADLAIPHARRLVSLDPLNEASHRQLMDVYLQAGQKNAALKQYQECEQILRKELNLDPQPETRELYRKIRKGEITAGHKKAGLGVSVPPVTAAADLPSGTVTFLFTDIEGSTRLATQDPDSMSALLIRHHEILNQASQMHHGNVFQAVGDSIAAAFHSASDALHAAIEAQRLLQDEAVTPAPIKVRMAVHTGTAHLESASETMRYSSYATLALTQRIMSTGHGGQVLVSQATHELIRGGLPEHIQFRDLGEYHLKDFAQTQSIYQLVIPGLVNDFPPLRISDAHPNNLPVQLSTFIGREKERAEITKLIAENRLVTLLGVGGIGKTRLSLESAREALGTFPGGVWFIELDAVSDPGRVPQTVFTTLGLIEQPGRSVLEILVDFLRSKRALLILDNCEHLIEASAQLVQNVLHSCSDLHILTTSREALGVPGEMLYIVPTLTTPDPLHTTLQTLSTYEAARLFIERAQSALPSFKLAEENVPAIAGLCHHLDGIPLAIELAAARVRLLRVEEIADRLDDRFRLLTGGARTALPRHQTLQALIDWSHDLLSEPERVLLRRLSIFAGGWTLEAVERVVGNGQAERGNIESIAYDLQPGDILDLLTSLVNKSLILVEHKPEQGARYDMLETIRQYARQKMWQAGEGERLRQRHLSYYIELAEQAEPNLRSFDMVMWLDRLECERDNIRSALEWAQESDIEAELRLASALLWFWHIRGHKNEGVEWLERALSIEAMDQEGKPRTPGRAMIRGKALNASGSLMVMNHEYDMAPRRLQESLALFKGLGPSGKQGMAYALLRLAVSLPAGDPQARGMLEESLAFFRELRDKFGIAECLMLLSGEVANFKEKDEDYSRAILLTEEQLALRREIGDQDGAAVALTILGDFLLSQDDYQKAILLYKEALAGFRAVKNSGALSLALTGLGDIFFWRDDYESAAEIYEESLSLARDLGYTFIIALNMYSLGSIAWFHGDYDRAVQLIGESEPMFRTINYHWLTASSLHALGDIALAQGDEERAALWYQDELTIGEQAQLEVAQIYALIGLGRTAWAQGDYALAAKHFEEGLKTSRESHIRPAMFHALYQLGQTQQAQGDLTAAQAAYMEALTLQSRRIRFLLRWVWLKTYQSVIAYPLAGLATLAAEQNNMTQAASLFGAAESLYMPLRFQMSARERAVYDQATAAARTALGDKAFAVAYGEGSSMSLDAAITYSLQTE